MVAVTGRTLPLENIIMLRVTASLNLRGTGHIIKACGISGALVVVFPAVTLCYMYFSFRFSVFSIYLIKRHLFFGPSRGEDGILGSHSTLVVMKLGPLSRKASSMAFWNSGSFLTCLAFSILAPWAIFNRSIVPTVWLAQEPFLREGFRKKRGRLCRYPGRSHATICRRRPCGGHSNGIDQGVAG